MIIKLVGRIVMEIFVKNDRIRPPLSSEVNYHETKENNHRIQLLHKTIGNKNNCKSNGNMQNFKTDKQGRIF